MVSTMVYHPEKGPIYVSQLPRSFYFAFGDELKNQFFLPPNFLTVCFYTLDYFNSSFADMAPRQSD